MTRVNVDLPDQVHQVFKTACAVKGLKVQEGVLEAIVDWSGQVQNEVVKMDIRVVHDRKTDLLTIIWDERLKTHLTGMAEAHNRGAPYDFQRKLRDELMDIVKQHHTITPDMAEAVKTVLNAPRNSLIKLPVLTPKNTL